MEAVTFKLHKPIENEKGTRIEECVELNNVVVLEKRRTSVDLSGHSQRELNWLMKVGGDLSRSEAIQQALYLHFWLATMEADKSKVIICDPDGGNSLMVLSLIAFNNVTRSTKDDQKPLRLTLELPAKAVKEIEQLREQTGEKKLADVIRQAIHINWVLLNEVRLGRKVIIRETTNEEFDLFVPSEIEQIEEPPERHVVAT